MIEAHSPDPYRSITEPSPEPAFASPPGEPEPQPERAEQAPRRSTVREAARFLWGQSGESETEGNEAPAPATESRDGTSAAEPGEIAPDRPRRSGWWSRR